MSKEQEFMSITVITAIPVPFWMRRGELQKGKEQSSIFIARRICLLYLITSRGPLNSIVRYLPTSSATFNFIGI